MNYKQIFYAALLVALHTTVLSALSYMLFDEPMWLTVTIVGYVVSFYPSRQEADVAFDASPAAPAIPTYVRNIDTGHVYANYTSGVRPYTFPQLEARKATRGHVEKVSEYVELLSANEAYDLTAQICPPWVLLLIANVVDLRTYSTGMLRAYLMQRATRCTKEFIRLNDMPSHEDGTLDEARLMACVNQLLADMWWISQGKVQ